MVASNKEVVSAIWTNGTEEFNEDCLRIWPKFYEYWVLRYDICWLHCKAIRPNKNNSNLMKLTDYLPTKEARFFSMKQGTRNSWNINFLIQKLSPPTKPWQQLIVPLSPDYLEGSCPAWSTVVQWCIPLVWPFPTTTLSIMLGRRKHLKLGRARNFEGTFFLMKQGTLSKIKRALPCLLQNLGGTRPQCPRFLRLWHYDRDCKLD